MNKKLKFLIFGSMKREPEKIDLGEGWRRRGRGRKQSKCYVHCTETENFRVAEVPTHPHSSFW
jgi:hypothetical protein